MNPAFHYKLFLRINQRSAEKIGFTTTIKEFRHESPIIAREQAFDYYQSYLDVLMQGLDKVNSSDNEARIELRSFYKPVGYVAVIMVVDDVCDEIPPAINIEQNEYEIHCIPSPELGTLDFMMSALVSEYQYYQQYSYDTKTHKKTVEFFGNVEGDDEPACLHSCTILETPFDWTPFTEPRRRKSDFEYEFEWTGFETEENNIVEEPEIAPENTYPIPALIRTKEEILEIISQGEGNQIEFKPTLVYNFTTGAAGISVKGHIAKAICAFLNANGGYLLIGVTDGGQIQGLDHDYKLAPTGKVPRDYFKLEFDSMIRNFFSPPKVLHSIKTTIVNIENKDVFLVTVWPSQKPIFVKGQFAKEFYVRGEASSNQITDIEEISEYCIEHFRLK